MVTIKNIVADLKKSILTTVRKYCRSQLEAMEAADDGYT